MEEKTKRKDRSKKILLGGMLLLIIAVIIFVCVYFFMIKKSEGDMRGVPPEMNHMGENVVSASGLTSTGMTEEEYELDFLETQLYVEESYLSMGDTVEAGTAVFKISEESLAQAREELENLVKESELAYRQGVIDYEAGLLDTESTYKKAEVNKKYVQAEYDSSLQESKEKVEELKEQAEEAQELYDEYKAVVENDYYYTYYNLKELQDVYYDNFTFLMDLYEKWDIEGLNDKYPNHTTSSAAQSTTQTSAGEAVQESAGGSGMSGGGGMSSGGGAAGGMSGGGTSGGTSGSSDESSKLTVYEMMEELVEANGEEYETAKESYEKDTMMAEASLDAAKSNLTTLQAELAQAQLAYEKQVILSKADYDTTVAESENAEAVYQTAVQKLEEELESLKDTKEEAEDNLEVFESTIGDGYFYTKSAGTIVMNRVRTDSYLSAEDIILAYSNPETVTVEASVSQSDISKVAVGDSAYVSISGYGNYEGKVTAIDPVSSSSSRSSVTYSVTVELSGDISGLESNLTAYTYIGLSDEEMTQIKQQNRGRAE